jgi:peptidoglycan hydrolase-like protein with peptidoglycan-binding domain
VGVVHPTAYAAQPALSIGAQGTSVQQLQNMLATLGYLHGPADGAFGPVTRAAVMTFQRAHHLTADGIVGPQTWNALTQALGDSSSGRTASRGGGIALQTAGKTVDPGSTATPAYPGQALRVGSRGSAVTQVQQRLKALGYNVGTVDGVFGPQTASAVTAFQRANHLTADGIVGPATWQALFAGNALRGPGTPGVNSSNGSSAAITSRSGGTTSTGGTVTAGTGSGAPSTGASGVTGSGTTRGNAGSGGAPGGTSVDSSSSSSDATLDYVEWASPAAAPSNPLTQSDAGMRPASGLLL